MLLSVHKFSEFFRPAVSNNNTTRTTKCVCNIVFRFVYRSVENAVFSSFVLSLQSDNIYMDFLKNVFLDVCFSVLVNSQIASALTGLNQLNLIHWRTRLVWSEIIYISFEKVRHIFLQDFLRFYLLRIGENCRGKYKATEK